MKRKAYFSLWPRSGQLKLCCLFYFSLLQDFFRNLSHWIQQHMDMNDAGNFLIETCDDTVSRDLKQQLLLLNGRWRELFVKVKHVNATHFGTTHAPPKNIELVLFIQTAASFNNLDKNIVVSFISLAVCKSG